VPPDLGSNWYVMPRPEGKRCLLVASRGRTISRLRNGSVLHVMSSPLPEGSPGSAGTTIDFCSLDCIYYEPNKTYYVQDLLSWGAM